MSQIVHGITTTQTQPHDKLIEYVERYQRAARGRPVSAHTQAAFDESLNWLDDWQGDIIFDSCCGVGESTAAIAKQFPDAKVIGIDKSAARLAKHAHYGTSQDNYRVLRADVNDFFAKSCAMNSVARPESSQLKRCSAMDLSSRRTGSNDLQETRT